jgi:SAM-dependent methyltransferase
MSDEVFDPDWLTLREPVDHRSRATDLDGVLAAWWAERPRARVLDLGCGTGSNLRYLSPRLSAAAPFIAQRWTLVDHDPALLERVRLARSIPGTQAMNTTAFTPVEVATVIGDLALEGVSRIDGSDLVTASALLDLVSSLWIDEMARQCAATDAAVLFALSYDGSITWDAPHPFDTQVRDAVNAHQRRDKGLGNALGPDAATYVARAFAGHGYRTWTAHTPWTLGPADRPLVRALVEGWATAAAEQRADQAAHVRQWRQHRLGTIEGGSFVLTVGHADVLALPPEGPPADRRADLDAAG